MAKQESYVGYPRPSQSQFSTPRQMKSGYEPSDTETEWQETPWIERNRDNSGFGLQNPDMSYDRTRNKKALRSKSRSFSRNEDDEPVSRNGDLDQTRNKSPLKLSRRLSSRYEDEPLSRNVEERVEKAEDDEPFFRIGDLDQTRNKSPLKVSRRSSSRLEDEPLSRNGEKRVEKVKDDEPFFRIGDSDKTRNKSPLKLSRRSSSRYEDEPLSRNGEETVEKADLGLDRTRNKSPLKLRRQSPKFEDEVSSRERASKESFPSLRYSVMGEKLNHGHRSQSAPKPRYGHKENGQRNPSPLPRIKEREINHKKALSVGELNENVAEAKISRTGATNLESTESISQGDIFFSKEYNTLKMANQENAFPYKKNGNNYVTRKATEENGNHFFSNQRTSSSTGTTRTTTASNSSFTRQSSDKSNITTTSSKLSNTSSKATRFVANIKKSEAEPWFSCLKRRNCRNSNSTEKVREFDETGFIQKAFVDENLRQFWADKHRPASLDGFTCHKQEAQSLKLLVSDDIFPHILLSGPRGSDKKGLTMALLTEIFGDSARDISHELRYFHIQFRRNNIQFCSRKNRVSKLVKKSSRILSILTEVFSTQPSFLKRHKESKPVLVVVPVVSSAHHVELNAYTEPNIKNALISLVKEISSNFAMTPDISFAVKKTDFKVLVLYDVDKATEKIHHLIKWIMDCYSESCKLILCCEDDEGILNSVKNRCKFVRVDAPVTHEIMEVLNQIAMKEDFYLPMSFAVKIANKSRHNLRQAIMSLEACRAHNYPFVDDQPIPLGWEEVVEDLAAEILSDPSHTRLFSVRGRFQKLLVEFVHPKLILQGLVEHFLKAVDSKSKRELYYWHAYYEKRLPSGTSALLKLEEFVAKFMSMHRRGALIKRNIPV